MKEEREMDNLTENNSIISGTINHVYDVIKMHMYCSN